VILFFLLSKYKPGFVLSLSYLFSTGYKFTKYRLLKLCEKETNLVNTLPTKCASTSVGRIVVVCGLLVVLQYSIHFSTPFSSAMFLVVFLVFYVLDHVNVVARDELQHFIDQQHGEAELQHHHPFGEVEWRDLEDGR